MTQVRTGLLLRAYLAASRLVPLISKPLLQKRLRRGKEDPNRWQEKLGITKTPRPQGRLVWMHAVGLGETLALRGLIQIMQAQDAGLRFLITSTTAKSAEAFSGQSPPNTVHQFLPLDTPRYIARFLSHWQPDLAIWTEQDVWPGFVCACHARAIPQAIVAARMNTDSARNRQKARGLYSDLYARIAVIAAQDAQTRDHISQLGGTHAQTRGSLKPAAPQLTYDREEADTIRTALQGRFVWIAAPTHPADEAIVFATHQQLIQRDPTALLILAPRFPAQSTVSDDNAVKRSHGLLPTHHDAIWLIDTIGELGLFYAQAKAAYVGGTNSATQGHNPWEAIAFSLPVFHGPQTANFATDYALLDSMGHAACITDPAQLSMALTQLNTLSEASFAALRTQATTQISELAKDLLSLINGHRHG